MNSIKIADASSDVGEQGNSEEVINSSIMTGTAEEIAAKRALRAAKRAASGSDDLQQQTKAKKVKNSNEIPVYFISECKLQPPIELCCVKVEHPCFLWNELSARKLFVEEKLWPAFVGMRASLDEIEAGALPIYIWKEQNALLSSRSFCLRDEVASSSKESFSYAEKSTSTAYDELRRIIFQDLHEKKYMVGPADGYGADYAIYKGDPSQTHSVATVRVLRSDTGPAKVSAKELLSYSRVQNHVKKKGVFAYVSDSSTCDCEDKDDAKSGGQCSSPLKKVSYLVSNFLGVSKRV